MLCRNYGKDLWVKLNPRLNQFSSRILLGLVGFYRFWISPMIGPHCRFEPTCSQYAVTAIGKHGAALGLWLTVKRLEKCHPLHRGGFDPVPDDLEHSTNSTIVSGESAH